MLKGGVRLLSTPRHNILPALRRYAHTMLPVPPAALVSSSSHNVPGQMVVTELRFTVPLDYSKPDLGTIELFGRRAVKYERPAAPSDDEAEARNRAQKPYMVYLEGGPGFGCRPPQEHPLTRYALQRGYQVLYLDHRGTGLSTPVSEAMLRKLGGADAQVAYLRLMRQDNTVRDCEAVRQCLTEGWPENKRKWSIFGQSYGGFVSMSYLSFHPEGLREVFLTGGLAPVGRTADEVYKAVLPRVLARNDLYYAKFPEDAATVRQIAAYVESQGGAVPLPGGGSLTVPRLMTIGIAFGGHGGFDSVHNTLLHLKSSLGQFGHLSRASLAPLESFTPFDTNIIYAILHEAIYCDGPGQVSDWAANRVGSSLKDFNWLLTGTLPSDEQPNFSGENIFPFHFDTYPELMALKEVADKLAAIDDWEPLYNIDKLRERSVPVYAASYVEDMYVDYDFARETAKLVGAKTFETNVMYHSALRSKADEVLQQLFSLRDDVLD